ncbi:MAG: hypothetical protein ACJ8D6_10150 [Sphingomicrobium sp.]
MATSGVHLIAAMAAKARREVREHFEVRDAFGPGQAVAYDPPSPMHRRQFDSLVGRAILLATGDGRYWLDRAAVRREEERRRAAAILMLKIIVVMSALSVAAAALIVALR